MLHADREQLLAALAQVATLLEDAEAFVPAVSGWSVGEHADHVAATTRTALVGIRRLLKGHGDPAGSVNAFGRRVLRQRAIPRGRGQAPVAVRPADTTDVQAVGEALAAAADRVRRLDLERLVQVQGRLPHPYFGGLNAVEWLQFIDVHTRHHLAIARDVLAAR
jgi:hypothetical protein